LHLLAMAFFVGGQLMLAITVVPVERGDTDRTRLRAIARRFAWGTLVAVAALVLTGAVLAAGAGHWGPSTLHLKLGLVALVAALIVWHMRRPALRALDGAIFIVSLTVVWLGVMLAHQGHHSGVQRRRLVEHLGHISSGTISMAPLGHSATHIPQPLQ
jgi:hypothetical protein